MALVSVLSAAALGTAYFAAPALGSVSAETLFYSVTGDVGGTVPQVNPCRHVRGTRWTCRVSDKGVSGYAVYGVELRGNCWKARKIFSAEEEPLPRAAAGCVGIADQLRLGTRIFDAIIGA
jgi:hypothetical protein